MPHFHLSLNVGSVGKDGQNGLPLRNEAIQVRKNVYELLEVVKRQNGRYPDAVGIQELGNELYKLAPKFDAPIAWDGDVSLLNEQGEDMRRKVGTYALPEKTTVFEPLDQKAEIVTTVHDYNHKTNKGFKSSKVAFINVYKNDNVNVKDRPNAGAIRDYILAQTAKLEKELSVRKVVVHGDFNDENFTVPGFRELCDSRMYHRHRPGTAKTFIDKVFANFADVHIRNVYDTCEYVSNPDDNPDLGHKAVLIQVGRSSGKVKETKIVSMKKFRALAKNGTAG